MLDNCKKCGGTLKSKGFIYREDKTPRYRRFKCKSCNAVEYEPIEDRPKKTMDWVMAENKAGRLQVWHDGKKWDVE